MDPAPPNDKPPPNEFVVFNPPPEGLVAVVSPPPRGLVAAVVPRPAPSLKGDAFAPVDRELASGEATAEVLAAAPVLSGVLEKENPLP